MERITIAQVSGTDRLPDTEKRRKWQYQVNDYGGSFVELKISNHPRGAIITMPRAKYLGAILSDSIDAEIALMLGE